jgi:hypothetical protein
MSRYSNFNGPVEVDGKTYNTVEEAAEAMLQEQLYGTGTKGTPVAIPSSNGNSYTTVDFEAPNYTTTPVESEEDKMLRDALAGGCED